MTTDRLRSAVAGGSEDLLAAYRVPNEPYYRCVAQEVELFELAHEMRMPLMLKGPTGCGKTRFVEHMAWRLGKPLITLACNEDLTAGDLVGRWLIDSDGMCWQDGPLTLAARHGAICYLDEVVEARADTTVVIHPLTDTRRILPIEKLNEVVHAHPDFHLVISYNPGYQHMMKDLKVSTRQRFTAIVFDFPSQAIETEIVEYDGSEGLKSLYAAALHCHRIRLSVAGNRDRDRCARVRSSARGGVPVGCPRRAHTPLKGPRPR